MPAALVMHGDCGLHDTGWGHPEHQGRLPAIVHAIERDTPALIGHVLQHEAAPARVEQIRRVHSDTHIETVRAAAESAAQSQSLVALDADTIVSPASWDAAVAAAGCAIDAVRMVASGTASNAFGLCRPPGHHATPETAMGFCLFNNAAIAARAAQAEHDIERVLIIDWDVHHGNGTQDIFYSDPSVFYLSLHLGNHYPGTGAAHETGSGAGVAATMNVPLPHGTSRDAYLDAFDDAVSRAFTAARPGIVIVSAGYDCLAGDPLGGLFLEPEDTFEMTRTVVERADAADAAGTVVVLEGGYVPARIAAAAVQTLRALAGVPPNPQRA